MQPKLRCTLKIWIKETLPLSKDRGIITKNIISLKYQKLAIAVSLNGKDGLMLLPTALKKLWIYKVNRNTSLIGNIVPDREFHWSSDHEFYTRLRIWNWKSVWSTAISIRKPMLLCKNESSLKRKQFHWRIFYSSESKSSKTKESLQDDGSHTKFSYQILPCISCKVT